MLAAGWGISRFQFMNLPSRASPAPGIKFDRYKEMDVGVGGYPASRISSVEYRIDSVCSPFVSDQPTIPNPAVIKTVRQQLWGPSSGSKVEVTSNLQVLIVGSPFSPCPCRVGASGKQCSEQITYATRRLFFRRCRPFPSRLHCTEQ